MNLLDLPIFKAMTGQMEWLNRRQSVLSENLANSDTPGFTPHDLQQIDFSELVKGNQSASAVHKAQLSAAEHASSGNDASAMGREAEEVTARGIETSPTGNSVVLEEQMMKLAENQTEYRLVTNLYKKNVGLLRMALGRGR